MREMLIELEPGVYLADGEGDPPRTMKKENAKRFRTLSILRKSLKTAREYRPFPDARFVEVDA